MRKMIIGAIICVVVLIWCGAVFSQQDPFAASDAAGIFQRFDQIEAKIDRLSGTAGTPGKDAEILAKLDQVLENQRQIARELEVIRVRVSRK